LFIKIINFFDLFWQRPFLKQSFIQFYHSIPFEFRYKTGELDIFDNNTHFKYMEKFLLRMAFSEKYFTNTHYTSIIPNQILWRTSTICFDGICNHHRPIYEIMEEKISKIVFNKVIYLNNNFKPSKNSNETFEFINGQTMISNVDLSNRLITNLQWNNNNNDKNIEENYYQYLFENCFSLKKNDKSTLIETSNETKYLYFNSGVLEKTINKKWLPKILENIRDPSSRKLPFYYEFNPEFSDRNL
jgi:hypothetical protein